MNPAPSPIARALLALVRLYQRSAMLRSPRCRFHPTCSTYAVEAITLHGAIRGCMLAVRRIGRCHPFHPGGIDPVPQVLPDVADARRPTMDTRPAA